MCKLFVITGKVHKDRAQKILEIVADIFGKTQKDGFGFVAKSLDQTARGRYLNQFPGWKKELPDWLVGPISEIGNFPDCSQFLIAHGRTSTNIKVLDNVHPFYNEKIDAYLAHNGVLDWIGDGAKPESRANCDSEQFLSWLAEGNQFDNARNDWSGYGAIPILDDSGLTVAKCSSARLYMARRRSQAGWILSSTAEDLVEISRRAGIVIDHVPMALDQRILKFDLNGKIISAETWSGFAPRTYDSLFSRSIGNNYFGEDGVTKKKPRKGKLRLFGE